MVKIRSLVFGLSAFMLLASLAASPVYAESSIRGARADQVEMDNESSANEPTYIHEQRVAELDSQVNVESEPDNTTKDLRNQAKVQLEKLRKEKKDPRSKEDRKKVCEARQKGMEQRFTKLTEAAQHHLNKLEDASEKLQAYKADNQVNVANWAELTKTVSDAHNNAALYVTKVADLKPTVDCTSDNVASDIATFKAAVEKARTELKAYRKALKDVVVALNTAKPETTDQGATNEN